MSNTTEKLKVLLADTYALYLKTQNYHWNVEGPNFFMIHEALESQYTELAEAVDEIAERIRMLGEKAPGSFAEFESLKTLKDANANHSAQAMLKDLADDHAKVIADLNASLKGVDEGSASLLADRLASHEKILWMLRSSI